MISQSAVYRLPAEILLSIFDFFINPGLDGLCALLPDLNETYSHVNEIPPCSWPDVFDVRGGPWVIAQVCALWRSTALSTPYLWRSFYVGVPSCSEKAAVQMLSTWVLRSGDRLLNFRIVADTLYIRTDGTEILRVLSEVSERWRIAEIVNASTMFWNKLRADGVGHNLSSLKELALLYGDDDVDASRVDFHEPFLEVLGNTPKLNSLINLDIVNLAHIDLPWAQLTTYASTFCSTTEQLTVLRRVRNLVRCYISVYEPDVPDEVEAEGLPIVLDRLRCWKSRWYSDNLDQIRTALKDVLTPALEELSVMYNGSPRHRPPFNIFASILRSSCCPLKSLELSGSVADERDILVLIEAATTISRLRIWLDSPIQHTVISCLDAKRDVPLAPLLEHLELRLAQTTDIRALDMGSLAVAIRSRLSSELYTPQNGVVPLQSLTFVIEGLSGDDYQFPPIIDVLQEEGLKAYIHDVKM